MSACGYASTYACAANTTAAGTSNRTDSPVRTTICLPQLRPLMRERQGGGWVLAAAAAALDATALPAACFHLPEAALRR